MIEIISNAIPIYISHIEEDGTLISRTKRDNTLEYIKYKNKIINAREKIRFIKKGDKSSKRNNIQRNEVELMKKCGETVWEAKKK